MKKIIWIVSLAILAISCSKEVQVVSDSAQERVFARIESSSEPNTKVFADDKLRVLWDANDRISLFNKYTFNKQYRFKGETGANSGEFEEVNPSAVVTGNELEYVYSVYPYNEGTTISDDGIISLNLPSEQAYKEESFGLGANTMISTTENTNLLFKNLCGYIVLKLYGEDVSVRSITLKGNDNEPLAGPVRVSSAVGDIPSFTFSGSNTQSITLTCPTPVTLGSTAEEATIFWLVVPPTTFSKGFTITVTDSNNGTFEKSTSSEVVVSRNTPFRMKALLVDIDSEPDYSKEYFSFEILSDGEIGCNRNGYKTIEYNLNNTGWITISTESFINVVKGDIVYFRGNNSTYGESFFSSTCSFNVRGNIMSLIDKDIFTSLVSLSDSYGIGNNFKSLFKNCTGLVDASKLIMPATILSTSCYSGMFSGCTSLVFAPDLPATSLAEHCYDNMFVNCSSLVSAPELPATSLTDYCYKFMFLGCSSLQVAPELPATTLGIDCYYGMFSGCVNLIEAPTQLPAKTLTNYCYYMMFYGCSNLTNAPSLPALTLTAHCYESMFQNCVSLLSAPNISATSLADYCCRNMFYGCTGLVSAPNRLPAMTLAQYCYANMFYGCTSLEIAPELPAPILVNSCYDAMFSRCSNLKYVCCLATDISAITCTRGWLLLVSSSGVFVKDSSMNDWGDNQSGIPSGWEVKNYQ